MIRNLLPNSGLKVTIPFLFLQTFCKSTVFPNKVLIVEESKSYGRQEEHLLCTAGKQGGGQEKKRLEDKSGWSQM